LIIFSAVIFRATWIRLFPVVHTQYIFVRKLFDDLSESVQIRIVAFPFVIILDMYNFSLDVATMNGALGYVQTIQAVNKHSGHAFGKAYFAHLFQFRHAKLKRFDEIFHVHGILAGLVQEEIEIECLIVAICIIVINSIVNLTILCDLYNGLILFYHLITLLY
jgi:hypothetical protein